MGKIDYMAMIDDDGHLLFPDTMADAMHFAAAVGARPVDPARFPAEWVCGEPALGRVAFRDIDVRCELVRGHEGEHGGRIRWES